MRGEKMGLFTKYCVLCGRKIEKGQAIVRFGEHFDSEAHAETYAKEIEEKQKASHEDSAHQGHGCCC
jgi:hypothetical protein